MRIGTVIYPLLAVCLAAYGGYRAVVDRIRFVRGKGGRARESFGKMYWNHDGCKTFYYMLFRMTGTGSDARIERYYSYTPILVPSNVPVLYVTSLSIGIAQPYRGRLKGWQMHAISCLPGFAREMEGRDLNGDPIWRVRDEYKYGKFCKDHGVPYRRLKEVMDDLRGQLYIKLYESGYVLKEDLR
jgi:hypothetical protein